MSYQVTGTVTAPQANHSHTEPTEAVDGSAIAAGTGARFSCGDFVNTGNVNQSVTVSASNVQNCSVSLVFDDSETDSAVLQPGQGATLFATVSTPTEPVGSADVTYSFEIDSTWS